MMKLFARLDEPRRWVYWLTAIPLLLAAEFAFEAHAHWPYIGAAAMLVCFYFWPCRFGWCLATTLYAAAAAVYLWETAADLWRLGTGVRAKIFVDADDTLGFVIWLVSLVVVLMLLVWCRPWRKIAPGH